MEIVKITDKDVVKKAVEVLKKSGLVVYPTETVYGIGADATNEKAVQKLTDYKNRPFGKPYSIAVTNQKMAEDYASLNKSAKFLYQKFLPGPLTVISEGRHKVATGVESENGTIGIRMPDYPLVTKIVQKFGKPITATSANASYKKRPYSISDILDNIGNKQKKLIDLIIDAGILPTNDPSTVVDTSLDESVTLRQGEIKLTDKIEVLSRSEENTMNVAKEIWQKYQTNQKERSLVFALQGEMGTGKTIFTKGLAKAMGIKDLVTSPTYAIENEYGLKSRRLYHFDAWRLENSADLNGLGFDKLIKDKQVISLEWAERVLDIVREFDDEAIIIWVKINYGKKVSERLISWGVL